MGCLWSDNGGSTINSNSGLTEWSKCHVWRKRPFKDLDTASSSGASHVPRSTLDHSESQRSAKHRFWIAAWYTEFDGYFRKLFLKIHLLETDHPLDTIIWRGGMRELRSSTNTYSTLWSGRCTPESLLTYWRNLVYGMMDYPRFQISEMYLGKFFWLKECQSWKFHYKTEVCSKSAEPQLTMQWIKEVEIATSIDDPMTSRSITDYDMLDAMIASALKKVLTHVQLWKRASVEEQRAQKNDRFLRGRQNCLHDLRAFSCNCSLWKQYKDPDLFDTHMLAECSWFRRSMEPCSIISKRSPYRTGSRRYFTSQNC